MKPCLVDANVLVALLFARHQHHEAAREWFASRQVGEVGMCRLVHLAVVRLLGTEAVLGPAALHPYEAWVLVGQLLEDERMIQVDEPPGIDGLLGELLRERKTGSKTVNDAYLAATAIRLDWRLTSFDKGMQKFRGLDLQLL